MFKESPFVGEVALAGAEVLVMIFGSLILGILLGYLLWGWTRSRIREVEEVNTALRAKLIDAKASLESIQAKLDSLLDIQIAIPKAIASSDAQVNEIQDEPTPIPVESTKDQHTPSDFRATVEDIGGAVISEAEETQLPVVDMSLASRILGFEVEPNDFKIVAGMDSEVEALLRQSGITTWTQLSGTSKHIIRVILDEGGLNSRDYKPKRWLMQAGMASRGEWKKLQIYRELLGEKAGI